MIFSTFRKFFEIFTIDIERGLIVRLPTNFKSWVSVCLEFFISFKKTY